MSTVVNPEPCRWCGQRHGIQCPLVKAIEYHPDGTVKRVEFMTPVDSRPIDWANIRVGPSGDMVEQWQRQARDRIDEQVRNSPVQQVPDGLLLKQMK